MSFLTEFSRIGPFIINIIEKMMKIAKFIHVEIFTPLYDENFTIDASITKTVVRIKTKISAFLLDSFKVVKLSIFFIILSNIGYKRNIL